MLPGGKAQGREGGEAMTPTQADYDKIADWLEASLEIVVMFKEGMARHDIFWEIKARGWGAPVDGYPSDDIDIIDNALRFWMKEGRGNA